jgi:hypothetical protein
MKILFLVILLSKIFIISSCGEKNKKSPTNLSEGFKEEHIEGNYRGVLRPLNNHLSGYLPTGVAEVKTGNGKIKISTILDDDAKVLHIQSLFSGTKCPSITDDLNQDGIIDFDESRLVIGELLIHLDGQIDGKITTDGRYPWGSGFTYEKSGKIKSIEDDIKSRAEVRLMLRNRVVMIYGVSKDTPLPESIAKPIEISKESSIPVVCGILEKIP